jgi:hypothetical protein
VCGAGIGHGFPSLNFGELATVPVCFDCDQHDFS